MAFLRPAFYYQTVHVSSLLELFYDEKMILNKKELLNDLILELILKPFIMLFKRDLLPPEEEVFFPLRDLKFLKLEKDLRILFT